MDTQKCFCGYGMVIKPLAKRVFLEEITGEQLSSGLIIPEGADRKPIRRGRVIAIGDGVEVEVGEEVYYRKWVEDKVKVDGVEYGVVYIKDVIAVVR